MARAPPIDAPQVSVHFGIQHPLDHRLSGRFQHAPQIPHRAHTASQLTGELFGTFSQNNVHASTAVEDILLKGDNYPLPPSDTIFSVGPAVCIRSE